MDSDWKAAEALEAFSGIATAVILGTGLHVMEDAIDIRQTYPYAKIPGFPRSTVKGHSGRLLAGCLGGKDVIVMSGRFHMYEGYSAREVALPIRVFRMLGVKRLLVSNAAGSLRRDFSPGDVMLITDHINFTGRNPLVGPNNDRLGPRFPDMTEPYSKGLANLARKHATLKGIELREGVYVQVLGPSMETASETGMLARMGADAVGMSTVMEVIQAVHCGMEVLAVSAITNVNDPDDYKGASLEDVIGNAARAGPAMAEIFSGVLGSL
jgi:purine-nucleoside phosphorylase